MIDDIEKTIAREKDHVRRNYKAEIKGIFGSYARGDFRADSDLDLLVDFDDGASLFDLVGLGQYLEDVLGIKRTNRSNERKASAIEIPVR